MKSNPTLRDYINVISERRWLVIVCVLVASSGALVTSICLPKVYEAKVRFKLDLSQSKPMFFSEIYTPIRVDHVESQLEIIKSRTLAQSVVKKLNLNFIAKNNQLDLFDSIFVAEDCPPGKYSLVFKSSNFSLVTKDGEETGTGKVGELFDNGSVRFFIKEKPDKDVRITVKGLVKSAEELQKTTSANQIKNTVLVLLKAKSLSPKLAADIANTLAREYINYSLSVIREAARGSKEFIESQIRIGYQSPQKSRFKFLVQRNRKRSFC